MKNQQHRFQGIDEFEITESESLGAERIIVMIASTAIYELVYKVTVEGTSWRILGKR